MTTASVKPHPKVNPLPLARKLPIAIKVERSSIRQAYFTDALTPHDEYLVLGKNEDHQLAAHR